MTLDVKEKVNALRKKYSTSDPFALAKAMDIAILYEDLGMILGYFDQHFRMQTIHINTAAPDELKPYICAHELGHAVLHAKVNTPFLSAYTLFSVAKIERQANTFAVELLLPDETLTEYPEYSIHDIAYMAGIPRGMEQLKKIRK